jgi:hypothetical protein
MHNLATGNTLACMWVRIGISGSVIIARWHFPPMSSTLRRNQSGLAIWSWSMSGALLGDIVY